ncbi:MAG: phytanoyl-CoA dioxygenase family protein [Actinomycetes bacterium]
MVALLSPEECDQLMETWRKHHDAPGPTWESDFYSKDPSSKRRIHASICSAVQPALDRVLGDHDVLLGVFVTNWPGPDGGLELHQHSTIVGEPDRGSLVVWCALTATTEANGTLHVVPRSHLLQHGVRPERTPSWHEEHVEQLLEAHVLPVELDPGQALVFDNQLIHCSLPNQTSEPRIAAASLVVPRSATPTYHELRDDGLAASYLLDSNFFLDNEPGPLEWARPAGLEPLAVQPWSPTVVSGDEIDAILPRTVRGGATASGLRPPGLTTLGRTARPVVLDEAHGAELGEFGYTVLPALSPEELREVQQLASTLGTAPDDPKRALNWTFHSHDAAHKQRVDAALHRTVWPMVETHFADYTPFLSTFITKWPGPDGGFAPHQDPTLVDERDWVGVTAWIPLLDVNETNGMLWFVPGSHRMPGGFRVADVDQSPFVECETAVLTEHGVGVPLAAGEVLVFDNRVIHFSLPNISSTPRVVASFGLRPSGAPSTLARLVDHTVEVYPLPDRFFVEVDPSDHHLWEPPGPPLFVAPAFRRHVGPREFARMCTQVATPPRGVQPEHGQAIWREPSAFCARCGSQEGMTSADREGRNNAQLLCEACRTSSGDEV